ncbi:MAG: hypothetical protein U9R53_10865 [Chloroflexota bacterium]|nr:hypothetical protein [Chloroflexota bacterium]
MIEVNRIKATLLTILVTALWIISAVCAFLLIIPILDSITLIYAAFWADPNPIGQAYYLGVSIRQMGVLILSMLFVIGIIGGAEIQARNFNKPSSWHFMFITYAVELTLFLFTMFF